MSSSNDPHNRASKLAKRDDDDDDEEDPVDKMMEKLGCAEQHYQVQLCMMENKDWRKCQERVKDFKECVEKAKKRDSKQS